MPRKIHIKISSSALQAPIVVTILVLLAGGVALLLLGIPLVGVMLCLLVMIAGFVLVSDLIASLFFPESGENFAYRYSISWTW